jgi:acyl transferase domain-containing protein
MTIVEPTTLPRGGYTAAVLGAACRFPGADDSDEYWRLLLEGRAVAADADPNRLNLWEVMRDPELASRVTTLRGGYLRDILTFDADYFNIAPREAAKLDPQQRLLLIATHDALEDAGLTREALRTLTVGVFVGAGSVDHMMLGSCTKYAIDGYYGIGNSHSLLANRLSYYYNLKGPSLTVDTACSSSLTALHVALQSLERDALDLAIVGGVNVIVSPDLTLAFSQANMLSPSGRCNTFSASADGYGRAEGVGVAVLARASDSSPRGSGVRCLIRSSAVNQDGRSNGITAPNGLSQSAVIRTAMARAGVGPADLAYIETHGTGTKLGDAIELDALRTIFDTDPTARCHVGSAKANVGHMEAAAGMGGVIKAMLMLEHDVIPPHPVKPPYNQIIEETRGRLAIAEAPIPLRAGACIGVSSFGFGGSNAHVIVARPGEPDDASSGSDSAAKKGPALLLLSTHDPELMSADMGSLAATIETRREPLESVANTLAYHRDPLRHRLKVVALDQADAVRQLKAKMTPPARGRTPRIAFVFTGQGSQYAGMGTALYDANPVFRDAFDDCAARIRAQAGFTVDDLLLGGGGEAGANRLLDDIHLAQLALFCLEQALARLVMAAGVMPAAVIGHSLGELVAQTVAGMHDPDAAVALVNERARHMQAAAPAGAMLTLFTPVATARDLIVRSGLPIYVAGINGATAVTVSGDRAAIDAFEGAINTKGLDFRRLRTRHAFHSPAFAPAAAALAAFTRNFVSRPAQLPVISNLDGQVLGECPPGTAYWSRHILAPVEFARGIATLIEKGFDLFLEIGPDRMLSQLIARDHGARGIEALSLQRRGHDGVTALLEALGRLFECGVDIRADPVLPRARPARLPARQLARRSFWGIPEPAPVVPLTVPAAASGAAQPAVGSAPPLQRLIDRQLHLVRSQLAVLDACRQGNARNHQSARRLEGGESV